MNDLSTPTRQNYCTIHGYYRGHICIPCNVTAEQRRKDKEEWHNEDCTCPECL